MFQMRIKGTLQKGLYSKKRPYIPRGRNRRECKHKARSKTNNVEEDLEEADINLRRGSNLYQYNVVDNFRMGLTNMFFGDLIRIEPYRESIQQYLAAVERKEQKSVKATQVEEKPVYRSYVRLERNSIQASWDMGVQILVCTKPLATKLGLK